MNEVSIFVLNLNRKNWLRQKRRNYWYCSMKLILALWVIELSFHLYWVLTNWQTSLLYQNVLLLSIRHQLIQSIFKSKILFFVAKHFFREFRTITKTIHVTDNSEYFYTSSLWNRNSKKIKLLRIIQKKKTEYCNRVTRLLIWILELQNLFE